MDAAISDLTMSEMGAGLRCRHPETTNIIAMKTIEIERRTNNNLWNVFMIITLPFFETALIG